MKIKPIGTNSSLMLCSRITYDIAHGDRTPDSN